MASLGFRERPAARDPVGLLILHHGRGADEHDLLPLADAIDPEQRLHVVTPQAPLLLPGAPGHHWYLVPRVGYPDPDTFQASSAELAALHDELWDRTGLGPERTVLGGFSMGTVMSYALGLGPRRPVPAGIVAFSGFIPTVEGWHPELAGRERMPVFIAHGRRDPVIDVELGRRAHDILRHAGVEVDYHEFEGGHQIEPAQLRDARQWLATVTARCETP